MAFDKRGAHGQVINGGEGSAAESAQGLAPDAVVVGAFHNVSAVALWGDDEFLDEDVIVVGDSVAGKQVAIDLAAAVTGRPGIDGGKLRLARVLEPFTAVLISINRKYKVHLGIRMTGTRRAVTLALCRGSALRRLRWARGGCTVGEYNVVTCDGQVCERATLEGTVTKRGGGAPTMHDVARAAGVSFKTVSNVVNDHPQVGEAIRDRVRAAIQELGYRPNQAARNLRSGRSGVIGLAVPVLSQAYFAQLADDVIQAAEARGLVVLVEQTGGDRERELEVLRNPRLALTDGLLFSPLGLTVGDVPEVTPAVPIVLLGEQILPDPVDNITMQNREGARAATAHLLGMGRRRVGLIGAHTNETESTAGLRMAGYRSAIEEAGVRFDPALIAPIEMWDRRSGAEAMRRMLESGVRPDAIFAMNDDLALGALRVLQDASLRVPEDVAVIGFDDVDESHLSVPRLSSVDPGRRRIAERAVDLLMERISNRQSGEDRPPRHEAPPFQLVLRESTGD